MSKFEVCLDSSFNFEGIPKGDFLYHVIEAQNKKEAERKALRKWGDDVVWVLGIQG